MNLPRLRISLGGHAYRGGAQGGMHCEMGRCESQGDAIGDVEDPSHPSHLERPQAFMARSLALAMIP